MRLYESTVGAGMTYVLNEIVNIVIRRITRIYKTIRHCAVLRLIRCPRILSGIARPMIAKKRSARVPKELTKPTSSIHDITPYRKSKATMLFKALTRRSASEPTGRQISDAYVMTMVGTWKMISIELIEVMGTTTPHSNQSHRNYAISEE
jgi:hypothetical protein